MDSDIDHTPLDQVPSEAMNHEVTSFIKGFSRHLAMLEVFNNSPRRLEVRHNASGADLKGFTVVGMAPKALSVPDEAPSGLFLRSDQSYGGLPLWKLAG